MHSLNAFIKSYPLKKIDSTDKHKFHMSLNHLFIPIALLS